MATIHKRRLVSGEVVWELTHGTGADRQRFTAGQTREEAQDVLRQFERQRALHGDAPKDDSVGAVIGKYINHLKTNRRHGTFRRYVRVLKTFMSVSLHAGTQRSNASVRCGRLTSRSTSADERREALLRCRTQRRCSVTKSCA